VDDLIKFFIDWGIVPTLTKFGATGIPLPQTSGISLENPWFGIGEDYIYLATNYNYSPSLMKKYLFGHL